MANFYNYCSTASSLFLPCVFLSRVSSPSISRFALQKGELAKLGLDDAAWALQPPPSLSAIVLRGASLNGDDVQQMCACITHMSALTRLRLGNGKEVQSRYLRDCSCQRFSLVDCRFDKCTFKHLCVAMAHQNAYLASVE